MFVLTGMKKSINKKFKTGYLANVFNIYFLFILLKFPSIMKSEKTFKVTKLKIVHALYFQKTLKMYNIHLNLHI